MEPREKFSPEFKEIVERIPDNYSTLLVWGLLFFVGLLILLSIIIKVPDRVTAEVRVTSTCPPITLRAQKQGKIRLLKKNLPCQCKAGEYIAILENPANTEHILLLKKLLYNKDIFTDSLPLSTLDDSLLFLGEVETAYYQYRQQRQNYTNLINDSKYKYEILLYDQKIINDSVHLLNLKKGLVNNIKQFNVRKKQYVTDSILFTQNAILESEYNQSYLNYLNIERQIISSKTEIFSKEQAIIDTKLRRVSLIREYNQQVNSSALLLQESFHNLITQIKAWENSYVFMSTKDGVVDFASLITDASFIAVGEPVFDIVFNDYKFFGVAILPSLGAGSVMRGQEANLKMDLYPYQEYGVLKGVVSNISLSSVDKGYLIYFDLPKGLTSSAGYDFAFAETMYGQAEIITKDKRLISRIFNQIYKLLNPSKPRIETVQKVDVQNEEPKTLVSR